MNSLDPLPRQRPKIRHRCFRFAVHRPKTGNPVGLDPCQRWQSVKGIGILFVFGAALVLLWAPAGLQLEISHAIDNPNDEWIVRSPHKNNGPMVAIIALGPVLSFGIAAFALRYWWATLTAALAGVAILLVGIYQIRTLRLYIPDSGEAGVWKSSTYGLTTLVAIAVMTVGWLLLTAVAWIGRRDPWGIDATWKFPGMILAIILVISIAGLAIISR